MKATILIVEDNPEISQLLVSFLQENQYETKAVYDGTTAGSILKNDVYDLVLMDLMLPGIKGEDLIRNLREYSKVPVIVISAKSMVETRIEMLRLGADDYILKPFNLDEVLVRIEAVLRRSGIKDSDERKYEVLESGELKLYPEENRVAYREKNIALTAKELSLLELFLKYPQKTYSKANLYETVWKDVYYYEDNTINVHVSNLRTKLKKATGHDYIETVWGIGYRLNERTEN